MTQDTVDKELAGHNPLILPNEISRLMERAGVTNSKEWHDRLPDEAFESNDLSVQRKHINRCWRHLFADLPEDQLDKTVTARGCLMEDRQCDVADYLRLFSTKVVPVAIELGILRTR
jgi:hypothetical protein